MRRVTQPNVERRRNFKIDQNGGEKLWVKNSRRWNKGAKNFGEKLQKYKYGIEIAGINLREGNCGREIEGVKLQEWDSREAKCWITDIEDN